MHGSMSVTGVAARKPPVGTLSTVGFLRLALRLAWRDLRGGARGFGILIGCLALGVAAIATVASVSRGIGEGLDRQGRVILGADAAFTLIQREANAAERAFLAGQGAVSEMATLRAMAVTPTDQTALVELKAVDGAYPAVGDLVLDPPMGAAGLLAPSADGRVHGAAADPLLMARLGLVAGDRVRVGSAEIEIRASLLSEPDKLGSGFGFGPRLLVSLEALRASGLIQPGSLVRWTYRVVIEGDVAQGEARLGGIEAAAKAAVPEAGWEIRTRSNADPRFARNIDRFTQFLTLVGLTALLVGGVGVANAVRRFVDVKRKDFATLKALGATGGRVVTVHLVQVLLMSGVGVGIGLVVGALVPLVLGQALSAVLPVPLVPTLAVAELGLAALFGLMTGLVFALLPLGRAHDVPVSALFRDQVQPDHHRARPVYAVMFVVCLCLLAALVIGFAYDPRIAALYLVAMAIVFVALAGVAWGVMWLARHAPRARLPALRMAVANMHRPGALTPSLVLSLGLGVALLAALTSIDGSLKRQLTQNIPQTAPSFFFLDIPGRDAERFEAFLLAQVPDGRIERVPMMRGRITAIGDIPADQVRASDRVGWVLDGDRGITFAARPPEGTRLISGAWWPEDHRGPPLVSFDHEIATGLGLRVGDTVSVNVLGRTLTARIANTRKIDWRGFGINFVMVFSPNSFAGAPHTHLATLTVPGGMTPPAEAALLSTLTRDFASATAVRVKEAIDATNDLVARLALAIRIASLVAIAASLLVLAGALAAGQTARLHDAMILKTLGATRLRIVGAYALEYALIGTVSAAFGLLAGLLAGWAVVTRVMTIEFAPDVVSAGLVSTATIFVTVLFGLVGTSLILKRKPASYLRSL